MMRRRCVCALGALGALGLIACGRESDSELKQLPPPDRTVVAVGAAPADGAPGADAPDAQALIARAKPIFGALPSVVENPDNPITEAKIALGRQLYFEPRMSKGQDISCNSCHDLNTFGVDTREKGAKTSVGHQGAFGDRNSPSVFNAALHIAQFWDGRAKDVEEQAKGPILNPVEMAMPSEDVVVAVLASVEGYEEMFKAAFPEDPQPLTYDNMARAIGAFERKLMTPAPFDEFLAGDTSALSAQEQRGLALFLDAGCTACHAGPAVGGQMYQKLGLLKPYPTEDEGRAKVTGNPADRFFFKVPSLRNIEKTGPYLHDGSIPTLEQMVQIMAEYQTPKGTLTERETADLVAFLKTLTGDVVDRKYIEEPVLLPSGPDTPKPAPAPERDPG